MGVKRIRTRRSSAASPIPAAELGVEEGAAQSEPEVPWHRVTDETEHRNDWSPGCPDRTARAPRAPTNAPISVPSVASSMGGWKTRRISSITGVVRMALKPPLQRLLHVDDELRMAACRAPSPRAPGVVAGVFRGVVADQDLDRVDGDHAADGQGDGEQAEECVADHHQELPDFRQRSEAGASAPALCRSARMLMNSALGRPLASSRM